jgi:hypothetical protein
MKGLSLNIFGLQLNTPAVTLPLANAKISNTTQGFAFLWFTSKQTTLQAYCKKTLSISIHICSKNMVAKLATLRVYIYIYTMVFHSSGIRHHVTRWHVILSYTAVRTSKFRVDAPPPPTHTHTHIFIHLYKLIMLDSLIGHCIEKMKFTSQSLTLQCWSQFTPWSWIHLRVLCIYFKPLHPGP